MGLVGEADIAFAGEVLKKVSAKMDTVVKNNRGKIPYTTDENGRFDDHSDEKEICWWTNGFWGGELWQLYKLTGNELYKED